MPKFLKIDKFIDHISRYIQVRLDMAKAEMAGQLAGLIATVFSLVLVLFFLGFFCLFLSIGLAILLNNLLESEYWGYIIIAFFYFALFVLIALVTRSGKLKEKIKESFLEQEENE